LENWLTTQILNYGYVAIFVGMLATNACIPIPSEVIMLFGGALASSSFVAGVTGGHHTQLNLVLVGVIGTLGSLVGSWIAYGVGRVGGRPLAERWGAAIGVRSHELDRAEAWFERRGEIAVLVARVIPVVRTFISFPAGVAEMPVVRFTVFTLIGTLPWVFGLSAAGYALADSWQGIAHAFTPVSIAIGVLAVLGIAWWIIRRRRTASEYARRQEVGVSSGGSQQPGAEA
jgi:membrane protein DedA with SNARE-associated domain